MGNQSSWSDTQKWIGGITGSLIVAFLIGTFGFFSGRIAALEASDQSIERRIDLLEISNASINEKLNAIKESTTRIEKGMQK